MCSLNAQRDASSADILMSYFLELTLYTTGGFSSSLKIARALFYSVVMHRNNVAL